MIALNERAVNLVANQDCSNACDNIKGHSSQSVFGDPDAFFFILYSLALFS